MVNIEIIFSGFQESLEIIKNNLDNIVLINNPIIIINNYALDEQNVKEILNSGALDLQVQVIDAHINNPKFLEKPVWAINNCAFFDPIKLYLGKKLQTFGVLINLLQTHKTERELTLKCLSALWKLTSHKENFQEISDQEVVTEIIGQMRF
ncbi:armadillo repeat-containing protein 4 armc4 [Anaeramoeba flamelloides]|uniref:Armadillo repeat-containing protein 4 armc4 n=1 Tax=Anaeramoeba flamelloides TaxID=1746091 RepID=A0AAV7YZL0_9EUKA|nr:armadillo repeat-containing protein 4 armc4 [Anaeramoeba flamelloides]